MKFSEIFLKFILPPLMCIFMLPPLTEQLIAYPLVFGFVIGVVNWKWYSYSPYKGVLYSILLSIVTFFGAYASIGVLGYLFEFLGEKFNTMLTFTIAPFIIGPALVFFGYKFLFKYKRTKFTLMIIIGTVFLLLLVDYYFIEFESIVPEHSLEKIFHPYTLWQGIMALALQLMIYQDSIKKRNSLQTDAMNDM